MSYRPIAVGEVLRCLAGKCARALTKEKANDFFTPFLFGVACLRGTGKIIHRLRQTIEDHWQYAEDLEPRRHMIAERSNEKLNFARNQNKKLNYMAGHAFQQ